MNRSSIALATRRRSYPSFTSYDTRFPTELQIFPLQDDNETPQRKRFASLFSRSTDREIEDLLPLNNGNTIPSRGQQYRTQFLLAFLSFLLSVLAFYYAYEALVSPRPILGRLIFSPSTTVFVINVLSQGVAFTMARVFSAIFETLRWNLASRKHGVSLTTFLGLSAGTSLFGVFRLLLASGQHRIWCLQRFLTLLACLLTADYCFQLCVQS
jgi:hypothetical protein